MLYALLQQVTTLIPDTGPGAWASLGVGGSLGLIMFLFYRQDRKTEIKEREDLAKDFKEVIINNTATMTEIRTLVQQLLVQQREINAR